MNSKTPLVSVIVNCFNGERYLNECIKSIINQTYKNWELIFWDNLSTDDSLKIIKNFKDKRIKIFKSKIFNNLYKSRNLAIKRCSGKYICFLDVDDMWLKKKLELQIKEISKNPKTNLLYTNYSILLNHKKEKIIKFSKKLNSGFITQKLLNSYDIGILTVMVRREIFKNFKFNGSYNVIGDFDFFINLSLHHKITALQRPLAIYRLHSDNFSSKKIDLYISELSSWIKKNTKRKKFKNYSFKLINILLLKLKIKFYVKKIFNIKLGM